MKIELNEALQRRFTSGFNALKRIESELNQQATVVAESNGVTIIPGVTTLTFTEDFKELIVLSTQEGTVEQEDSKDSKE